MSSYQLRYKQPAHQDIQQLPPHIQARIKAKLEWLARLRDPAGVAEPLPKATDAHYRLRTGVYRILFDIQADAITVLHIQHRREVYHALGLTT